MLKRSVAMCMCNSLCTVRPALCTIVAMRPKTSMVKSDNAFRIIHKLFQCILRTDGETFINDILDYW